MNEHPSVFRYLIEDNPPTLWGAVESFVKDYNITPGQFIALFRHRPETVREICEHKRPMDLLDYTRLSFILGLSPDEVAARYVANAPAEKIGEIEHVQKAVAEHKAASCKSYHCDCISYNQPKPDQRTPEVILKAPEWSSRDTICVDACIAHVITHLWENGVITRGCCCGHGNKRPSVVLDETQDPAPVPGLIAQVDDREWDVLQWVLVRPLLLPEGVAVNRK